MWRLRRSGGFRPRAHLVAHLPHPTPGQQEQTEQKEKMSRKRKEVERRCTRSKGGRFLMWRRCRPGGFRTGAHLPAHLPHPTPGQQEQAEQKEKMRWKGKEVERRCSFGPSHKLAD